MPASTRYLRIALAAFVLAALTGALYRFAAAYGVTLGLDPVGIRHGHSHLMYFGWITPALFVLIARAVGGTFPTGAVRATLALAAVAFVPFLLWGYEPVGIGSAEIPVAVIASSANMLAWYAWVRWYLRARRGAAESSARLLWDVSAWFLVGASAGAWLIALALPLGLATPAVKSLLAHVFLDWFADGWFVFGLLGVAYARTRAAAPRWAVVLAVAGTAGTFLLGLPGFEAGPAVRIAGRGFGAASAVGVLALIRPLWGGFGLKSLWTLALWILALKAAGQLGALLVLDTWWADVLPMRVLYLHLHVLGFATLAVAAEVLTGRTRWLFAAATLVVLASLVPFTGLWPLAADHAAGLRIVAWLALLPPVAAVYGLIAGDA